MRELYRQPIKTGNGEHVTMHGMVSDLTGLVRGYHGKWQRPLGELRKELQQAHQLGNRIVRITPERPWRQAALEDILRSLQVQDRQMHALVRHILITATASYQIAKHKDLHEQFQIAFQEENGREIREITRQLYTLSHQTLDFLDSDSLHSTVFSSQLEGVKKEDPVLCRRILFTLNEVTAQRTENKRKEIPRPRFSRHEVEVHRNS